MDVRRSLLAFILIFLASSVKTAGIATGMEEQDVLEVDNIAEWRIGLSRTWEVLGPFPISAREQYFLSPGFPLELSFPYTHEQRRSWPSSYADNAQVTWSRAATDQNGNLAVSFPGIRWENLRSTEGWAALQYHALLWTTITVFPSRPSDIPPPRLLVGVKQGSHFAVIPRKSNENSSAPLAPEWHVGNVYDMHRAPPTAIELPGIVRTDLPTVYDLFVSGDYEIRLFGDPRDRGEEIPVLRLGTSVSAETKRNVVVRQDSHDIVCDFVYGSAFGDALGVGVRSVDGWWTVKELLIPSNFPEALSLSIVQKQSIAPSQTRVIPISLAQTKPFLGKSISFSIILVSANSETCTDVSEITLPVTLTIRTLPLWSESACDAIRASFFFATSHPTLFLAKPPKYPDWNGHAWPPVLALHGAGVDIISAPFWSDAVPRQKRSWVIMPVGRTEWGSDWHGPSASEVWATIGALSKILKVQHPSWAFAPDSKVVLLGHSNGGQGVWYLASRYPDRVRAAVPAAGYIKSQAYVPLIQSNWSYIDPSLRAVLESSFTPDDNDLFLSNVADMPILAIHGGNDTNVPTWHSRESFSVVKAWGNGSNVALREDKNQPHWYPGVFKVDQVQNFLDDVFKSEFEPPQNVTSFTLTVVDPARSSSLHGWRISHVRVPGRLARVIANVRGNTTYVQMINVLRLTLGPRAVGAEHEVIIDGEEPLSPPEIYSSQVLKSSDEGVWIREASEDILSEGPPPHGRVQNILDTSAPLTIIVPNITRYPRAFSAALRIAHNLDVYHKLDAEIISDEKALYMLFKRALPTGNLVVIGGPAENRFADNQLRLSRTEFSVRNGSWTLRSRAIRAPSVGIVFTHPHPMKPDGLALFVGGTDDEGLERALRLFPVRTGVAVPDWVVVGAEADRMGAGGVLGAGVWNDSWKWNEPMSFTP